MWQFLHKEFEFYIVTRNTEYLENTPYENVFSNRWNHFSENVKVYYTSSDALSLKQWRFLIREIKPDTVYINGIYSKYFSIYSVLAAKNEKVKKIIVSPRGMFSQSAIDVKGLKKRLFISLTRFINFYKNIEWHATNEKEKEDIYFAITTKNKRKTDLSSNSHNANLTYIAANLPRKTELIFYPIEKKYKILRLCIIARIAPEKNTLFAINCLKNINKEIKIEIDLFGQIYNEDYWQKCKSAISQLPENITLNYCGIIEPEKITETILNYHALFLPSRGENFGHIILESFMAGRPVIISDQTPWKNLREKNAGFDLELYENKFVEAIEEIAFMQQSDYDIFCKSAFELAKINLSDINLLESYRKMVVM